MTEKARAMDAGAMQIILGGGGQLGRALKHRLGARAVSLSHPQADITEPRAVRDALARLGPAVVFNCAAYNDVDRAEFEPETAFAVNAIGVRDLATACTEHGAVFVHFSTNYVFGLDAARRTAYAESDAPGPLSVYGASKLAGEYFARAACPRHYVVRTCGLYGESDSNFVAKILKLGRAGKPLRVVNDRVCTPTSVADLADAALALVVTGAFGLYHITNGGACSWHEFAQAILEEAGLAETVQAISSAEYGTAAARPEYSVLSCAAYQALGLPPLRDWRTALKAFGGGEK